MQNPVKQTLENLKTRISRASEWWQSSRLGRANHRFNAAGGGVMSGGIAYSALFSLVAALTIGWTSFVRILGGNEALREQVTNIVADWLPGIVDNGEGDALLNLDELVLSSGWGFATIAAAVVLLFGATAMMGALRSSVRIMFGMDGRRGLVKGRVLSIGGFWIFGLLLLLSAALTIVLTRATDWLLGLVGVTDGAGAVSSIIGVALSGVLDGLTFVMVVLLLAGARPRRRDLVYGAAVFAVAFAAVRWAGTSVIGGGGVDDPLLAPVAWVATLLIWLNLLARILLWVSAWTANPPLSELQAEDAAERAKSEPVASGEDAESVAPAAQA